MEEGTIVRWLRVDGDEVARGEEIVEIETDKATMAYEADHDGVLQVLVAEGETVSVGTVIATVGDRSPSGGGAVALAGMAVGNGGSVAAPVGRARVNASPVAQRVARHLGIDIADVRGTGANGRILKADVVATTPPAHLEAPPKTTVETKPAVDTIAAKGDVTLVELSRLQQTIARRMAESKATVPDFTLQVDVDMTDILDLRARLKDISDPAPSINDLIVKLVAVVLRRHPRANGAYRDGRFEQYARINVGIAVAAEGALVVPTVFDADRLTLGELAQTTRRLAARVRDGSMSPPELSGGTFTVSNLGMFGIDRFAGVINPPQAAILCVGATTMRAVVRESGAIEARPVLTLTLVSDHRILYGADAAAFLGDLRRVMTDPLAAVL
jgi:pyruvate dehydrogenase E2 component (dihydrolipoamide acetyltransferase)